MTRNSSVKVILDGDRALVPTTVDGKSYNLLLDTGSAVRFVRRNGSSACPIGMIRLLARPPRRRNSWLFTQRTPLAIRHNNPYHALNESQLDPQAGFFQLYGGLNWCGGDAFHADVGLGEVFIPGQALGSADVIAWGQESFSGLLGLALPYWNTGTHPRIAVRYTHLHGPR
ncbi:hypothetical protein KEM52_005830 [Ascosphaera acerosa]|nr:hypothetical protein KEM52_005830 [Ascosphaera acerosa]